MVAVVGIALCPTAVAAAAPPNQAELCRNPAYASMHENECMVRGHGVPGSGNGDGGLLGVIGRIVGGIL